MKILMTALMRMRVAALLLILLGLTGCVTVNGNDVEQEPYVRVSGVAIYKESTLLPANSRITVAIIDADKPGVILTQKEFAVAKLPVPFFFAIPEKQVDTRARYVVWAGVKSGNTTLLLTQDSYEVINNDVLNANVMMKLAPQ